jgi:hypothetical protein
MKLCIVGNSKYCQVILMSRNLFNFKATNLTLTYIRVPVTVADWSKINNVFARSEAGTVGSNPTQGMDVWYVYVFILSLCCPAFR